MKISAKKNLLLHILIFISTFGFSQSGEIKVKFIGNCGMYLSDGSMNLYIDFPYKSGAHKYMEYDDSELQEIKQNATFLFTHRHKDHYSKKLVRKMKKDFGGKVYGNWNNKKLDEMNNTANDFSIQSFKTSHMFTLKHYSYVITWHGKRIYLSGDTGDLEEVTKLENLDWAFINPWLLMNAQKEEKRIDAKMFGVYHLYPFQKLPEKYPDNILFMKKQKEIITIPY